MKFLGKIIYGSVIAILLVVAGLFALSFVPAFGIEIKIVKSGSMEPAIPTGSIVVVRAADTYKVGDVITFGKDTKTQIPTTHRIIAIRSGSGGPFYTTQGDANEEQDPQEVAARDVIGKVYVHVPGAGYVLDFARQPLGFALLIGLPAAMIILDEGFNIAKEMKALRRKRRRAVKEQESTDDEDVAFAVVEPPSQSPRVPTI